MSPQQLAEAVALRQSGFLLKQIAPALDVTFAGLRHHLSKTNLAVRRQCPPHPMDGAIVALKKKGLSTRAIAKELGLPRSTVVYRLRRIPKKTAPAIKPKAQGSRRRARLIFAGRASA
ncbi:MAG: hypothetical protein QG602_2787 [Verrucomicrobiota bacterium]|nr:hypothetical protein [Verrucomicrobiota bacterium]